MSFPLYLDENVDTLLAKLLNELGHDVLAARDAGMARAKDDVQFEFAVSQGRAIFTHDIGDYARLAHAWSRAGLSHYGVIVSRRRSVFAMRDGMLQFFADFPDGIKNAFLHLSRPPLN